MRKMVLAFAVLGALTTGGSAEAAPAGLLRCTMVGGFSVVISRTAVTCVFYRLDDIVEFYTGSSNKFGFAIGPSNANRVSYNVEAPDPNAPALLQGNFVGPGAGLTLGTGGQADVLVGGQGGPDGGRGGLVTLLPARVHDYTGLNINAGIDDLQLTYAGSEHRTLHSRY